MKALVIGGNGFVGSHLVEALLKAGWQVSVFDLREPRYGPLPSQVNFIRGDLEQLYILREALTGVDLVFHLAWTTIHETANKYPAADVTQNLIPAINLFQACRQLEVKRVIFTSSGGTVYGPAQQLPIAETHPHHPITAYGITKLATEKYLQMFHHLYGLEYAIVRPSVPYGPYQNPLARQGAVAVFLYRVGQGLPVTIWGDGQTVRDYFYVADLAQALVTCAQQELTRHRIFNIGGGEGISLLELLAQIEETVERKSQVTFKPARPFDVPSLVLDTGLARRVLGWKPQTSLSDGLGLTWQWMRSAF